MPFYYVVISEEAVAPSSDESETSFLSAKDEMVARTPILEGGLRNLTFKTDTTKVWGLIYEIMRDLDFWIYFKSAHRTIDGSKAYCDL